MSGTPVFVGVDVGGTKIHVAVAVGESPEPASAGESTLLAERISATQRSDDTSLSRRVRLCIDAALADADVSADDIAGIGIGVAGVVDPISNEITLAPNLQGLGAADIRAEIAHLTTAPVVFDNDVNLAIRGEWTAGHARGLTDFVFIAVGTGIGMGIVAGGRLLLGSRQGAGEIGYLPLGSDPFDAANQVRGPLEEVVAGEEIAVRYRHATGTDVSTRDVFDLAASGDQAAVASLEVEAKNVALAIASVRAILDPSLVVLGGGVGSRPELRALLTPWLERVGCGDLDVRTSALGSSASVRGAVELARDHAARTISSPS